MILCEESNWDDIYKLFAKALDIALALRGFGKAHSRNQRGNIRGMVSFAFFIG
jgi:hypothetical protein